MRDVAVNIRQTEVATGIAVRQFLVIDPHLMQDRRMQIVNAHAFINGLDGLRALIMSLSMARSFDVIC